MNETVLIRNIRRELDAEEEEFLLACKKRWGLPQTEPVRFRIVRQSLDARKKNDIFYSVHLEATLDKKLAKKLLTDRKLDTEWIRKEKEVPFPFGTETPDGRIVVAGLGPGGLFAAWKLAQNGYRPLVIERGKPVSERVRDVEVYWNSGQLDPESNVMFGEGGAGTFSDGKLTTRIKDPMVSGILEQLIKCGAPEEIGYLAKPHIGTDRLRSVVGRMRQEIETLGGEVRFSAKLCGIGIQNGKLTSVSVARGGHIETIRCAALILAIGQGARDTYQMLFDAGVAMQPKAFAVGVRAEHPQELINRSQYGDFWDHPRLGAAEYRLTAKSGTLGVYTFCMCPGGRVIASASGKEQVVVNGMSDYARNGENANAAVVVQVGPEQFGYGALDGLRFQARIEAEAYRLGEGTAPACLVGDFLAHRPSNGFGSVKPTYLPYPKSADLRKCLPDFVAKGIEDGLKAFGHQLKGYDMHDAVLTAVESRTSAPVRILRGEDRQSVTCQGLYPVGEGAGYAGGIVSAGVDGWHAAEAVMKRYKPDRP